jgi:uncharacterized protein (TIGR03083 family)
MEIAEHVDAVRRQGEWLADAAERAGLDATVPPCAPWQVKDLLRHTGYVHRWAARHITECPDQIIDGPSEEDILRGGADDAGLLAWFRDGHAALLQTLATADPAVKCATFIAAPSPLAFWARRQAHETTIHRVDAERALSEDASGVDPAFAVDGVDELLLGFYGRRNRVRSQPPVTLGLIASDTDAAWLTRLTEEGAHSVRSEASLAIGADAVVTAPAATLYCGLWNRAELVASGDPAVLPRWRDQAHIRWS